MLYLGCRPVALAVLVLLVGVGCSAQSPPESTITQAQPAASSCTAPIAGVPCLRDADWDGVLDGRDQCPDSGQSVRVDGRGCPLDSDRDGIANRDDACPDSAAKWRVDSKGCSVIQELAVSFSPGSSKLTASDRAAVSKLVAQLKQAAGQRLELAGHTDTQGGLDANQALSKLRAQAVLDYLVEQGVDATRFVVVGYGERHPLASNTSAEGRAVNRRVEVVRLD